MDADIKILFWLLCIVAVIVLIGMRCSAYAECKRAGHTDNYCAVTAW